MYNVYCIMYIQIYIQKIKAMKLSKVCFLVKMICFGLSHSSIKFEYIYTYIYRNLYKCICLGWFSIFVCFKKKKSIKSRGSATLEFVAILFKFGILFSKTLYKLTAHYIAKNTQISSAKVTNCIE